MRAQLACVVAALGAAGCGGPGSRSAATSTASAAVAAADRSHEYPGPSPRQSAVGLPTPVEAIDAFATGYINWTADTIAARMRALAAISVGEARSAVILDAAQTAQDYELRRSGIANSGMVEAIARLPGSDRYVVVTRERTTAANTSAYAGLMPAWHLALATAARVRRGWAVSSFQPQN